MGASAGLGVRSATSRAIVQIPGSAARLPASTFHSLAKRSQTICDLVVGYNETLFRQVQQSVACNALHQAQERLCRWLLQCQDCVERDVLPLTHEFLAQMLGVRRTTVTIMADALQDANLIRYRRGHIHIVNRAGLEDRSCECYAVVRHQFGKVLPLSDSRSMHPAADKM